MQDGKTHTEKLAAQAVRAKKKTGVLSKMKKMLRLTWAGQCGAWGRRG